MFDFDGCQDSKLGYKASNPTDSDNDQRDGTSKSSLLIGIYPMENPLEPFMTVCW